MKYCVPSIKAKGLSSRQVARPSWHTGSEVAAQKCVPASCSGRCPAAQTKDKSLIPCHPDLTRTVPPVPNSGPLQPGNPAATCTRQGEVMPCKSIPTLTLDIISGLNANVLATQAPAATFSDSAPKTSLTVSLTGIRNDKGQVFTQLRNKPDGFSKQGDKVSKFVAIDAN